MPDTKAQLANVTPEMANAIQELSLYKAAASPKQRLMAALAIGAHIHTVENYLRGEVKKLHTADDLLTWLRANVKLPASLSQAAA